MKLRLTLLALLLAASGAAQADNFRIVQSPSQKLDVWIDNVKGNTAQDWCDSELSLRIVTGGSKSPKALNNFLPRVGALLEHQCGRLRQMNWSLVDGSGAQIARGSAAKSDKWAVKIAADAPAEAPSAASATGGLTAPEANIEARTPLADRTPWQEFTLMDGCRLRTFWQESAGAPALFIPTGISGDCGKGGWLSGKATLTRQVGGEDQQLPVTFVHGFPVTGLGDAADPDKLLIAAVNKQRMVLSTENAGQSWIILPYDAAQSSWKMTGTLAVEISREQAADPAQVQAKVEAARKAWTPWLPAQAHLSVVLIDGLLPRLSNPAARAWRAAN